MNTERQTVRADSVHVGDVATMPMWNGDEEEVYVRKIELTGDDVTFNDTWTTSVGNDVRVRRVHA